MFEDPAFQNGLSLSIHAQKLRGRTVAFSKSLPDDDARENLIALLRKASAPSITPEAASETVYNLAIAVAEFANNPNENVRPNQVLMTIAKDFVTTFNGYGRVSRPVPAFTLT